MRLTCPNCGARYEVPDEVIPPGGRDVQCSNCDQTWFQKKPEAEAADKAESPKASPVEKPADAAPPDAESTRGSAPERSGERSLNPAVAEILRAEAAREAELRAKEAGNLEVQPDLGLPEAVESKPLRKPEDIAVEPAEEPQRGALPDVEEINSSLLGDRETTKRRKPAVDRESSGGFLRGFALVVILGVVLIMIYGNARQIAETVPQAEPALDAYVSLVDQARIWLETQAAALRSAE